MCVYRKTLKILWTEHITDKEMGGGACFRGGSINRNNASSSFLMVHYSIYGNLNIIQLAMYVCIYHLW